MNGEYLSRGRRRRSPSISSHRRTRSPSVPSYRRRDEYRAPERRVTTDSIRKIHSEYLRIMQEYYSDQYVFLADQFFAKHGNTGRRAREFSEERNGLFQGSGFAYLSSLLERHDLNINELYSLTEKYQRGMKRTLKNLKSML